MKRVIILFLSVMMALTAVPALAQTTYTVQPGDTLSAIAARFGVTVTAVAEANHIVNPNLINVGQVLTIPGASDDSAPAPAPDSDPEPAPAESGTYVVQAGDSLAQIAAGYGVTVAAVAQANGINNPNLIYPGQVLAIPGAGASAPPAASAPAPPPQATPAPAPAPAPETGANLLPNWSFEEGWYNQNGIPELQLPNQWRLEYDQGDNPFGNEPWSDWVRPETRVLSTAFLPEEEHDLYIYNGQHTVKIFKGAGAISARLLTDVALQPGTYRFTINVFPDLVMGYHNRQKIWAADPFAGEVRFIVGGGGSEWRLPAFGQRNTMSYTFTVDQAQTLTVGVALRGRYALENNGWFMDDWSLVRVQ